jgi:transposase InsO family protein
MHPSMGRVGSCFDNAVAESFFATLKTEIGTLVWATREDARRAVFAYLGYYNHDRLHSTIDYRNPHEVRVSYRQNLTLVA